MTAVALAITLGLAAGAANATGGTITIDSTGNAIFGSTFASTTTGIEDFWSFTLPSGSGSTGGASVISGVNFKTKLNNVNINEFELLDTTHGMPVDDSGYVTIDYPAAPGASSTLTFSGLTVGHTYALEVEGSLAVAGKSGSYSGNVSIDPVPEASEWAMMASGLGLFGFIASRRNKKTA